MTRETGERAAIQALEPPQLVELRRRRGGSRDLLSPAVLIMDALHKAFDEHGWKISSGSNERDREKCRKHYVLPTGK
jgi:hypothetical protein